ncbi:MAG: MBL fold metallo-hydrolase [Chromatiales bacterium]|jgi:glyoxylase-like metal-dependent hydrolase (beta-lactamase superfamily II)|nr:MBL fold metallo-hydrolase [Chromatiales bacterium]MDP7094103.1 MBL fold metallo-hydrolase [Gammaproteobacteria bacterium]
MFGFGKKQWVCTVCGYNMIGKRPARCPFCSSLHKDFVDSGAASRHYCVTPKAVTDTVTQLKCVPRLGLGHAAYRIDADGGSVLIDCPSAFNRDLDPVDSIMFTHKDFIGAANQYREAWQAEVWLHEADAELSEVAEHSVDHRFTGTVEKFGVEGVHIGGHSPGFTVYLWQEVLFIGDYVYPPGAAMKLNPHGPLAATRDGAGRLVDVATSRLLTTVCGYNYVTDFATWQSAFMRLV